MNKYLPNVLIGVIAFIGTVVVLACVPGLELLPVAGVTVGVGLTAVASYAVGLYQGERDYENQHRS